MLGAKVKSVSLGLPRTSSLSLGAHSQMKILARTSWLQVAGHLDEVNIHRKRMQQKNTLVLHLFQCRLDFLNVRPCNTTIYGTCKQSQDHKLKKSSCSIFFFNIPVGQVILKVLSIKLGKDL